MANALFDEAKNSFLGNPTHSAIDLDGDDIKCLLVDTGDHTWDTAADIDHADVTGAGIVATSGNLTVTVGVVGAGVVDVADFAFSAVSGDEAESLCFYKDSGASATSPLICVFDTGVTGLPITPNGGDVNVAINASGLFTL
jgi:hypothetical protein